MSIKQKLIKLEAAAAARAPRTQTTPYEILASYQRLYPICQMTIDPGFKFKHAGQLTLTDAYDFFENGLMQ